MSEYEQSSTVRAKPDTVFRFVSDPANLPKYLPTLRHAEPQGTDRVRVQGEAGGHRYDSDGRFRADPGARRLEWGADEGYYSGWLQVAEAGDGSATVTVHLSMSGYAPAARPGEGPNDEEVRKGIGRALEAIRAEVEDRG